MKKKLLYLTSIVLFSMASINAQTTVWDFQDSSKWPLSATPPVTTPVTPQESNYLVETVVNKLGIVPGLSTIKNFGTINLNNAVFDTYSSTTRFQMNGAGYTTATGFVFTPTQRYLYFNLDGAATVKVWFKTGSNSAVRTIFVTDGKATIASGTSNTGGNTDFVVLTADVSTLQAAAGKIYIFGDAANNLYKIEVTGANVITPALATDSFQADSKVTIYGNDGKINIANVTSATKVSVYNVLGSLVKSTETSGDVSLPISTSGVYIVKAQSEEGAKTVKVLVN
ncbi:T9SS type A sorting domain-containing protein [Flavobacterium sp.]|uniref:T9SS type A sorting domain-containing protein n=1 Tax=Flavobacterium sp. TaxID=239 RepID=UPI002D115A4C|nr:T9SS type A sorting domain-containing protein [Flavobacterium sp.]HSD09288.1 T9SS type A sorting domain-containing protein [Flavobacterium sp.]